MLTLLSDRARPAKPSRSTAGLPGVRSARFPLAPMAQVRKLPSGRQASQANPPRRSSWRLLRQRDFAIYFYGSLASNLGTWLQNAGQALLAYHLTHSVFAVGAVTGAQFAGSLFFGPWAAVVASRYGGRRMLIATQLGSAALAGALAGLQAAGLLTEPILIIGALGLGLAFTFALPIQTALVPRLVGAADTKAAMTMNSVSYNAGRALGPALCVAVLLTIGFEWAFALNAVSFVVFAIVLTAYRAGKADRPRRPARVWDGVSTALLQPRVALLLAMVATVTFADDPVLVLGPAVARHMLGAGSDWAGYFLSALGCGTVLASFLPTRSRPLNADNTQRLTRRSSRRAAAFLLLLAAAIVLFAAGIAPWLSLLAALVAGMAALLTGAATQTLLIRQRPADVASVMALWAIAWAGTKPIASLLDGWLASQLGNLAAAIILTLPALLLGLAEVFVPDAQKAGLKQWAKAHGRQLQRRLPSASPLGTTAAAGGLEPQAHI